MHAIKLICKNDNNGNPRRLFLVLDNNQVIDAIDEGFRGNTVVRQLYPKCFGIVCEIETTVPEYKRMLKMFSKNR